MTYFFSGSLRGSFKTQEQAEAFINNTEGLILYGGSLVIKKENQFMIDYPVFVIYEVAACRVCGKIEETRNGNICQHHHEQETNAALDDMSAKAREREAAWSHYLSDPCSE